MKKRAAFPLLLISALWLSACTMSKPPAYDLPSSQGLYPGQEITVQSGENLYVIAQKNNVRLRDLIVVNNLEPPYHVKPGQSLYLPTRDGDTAPTPKAAPLEYIDKGGMGPKIGTSGSGNDSVTSISLDAPQPTAAASQQTASVQTASVQTASNKTVTTHMVLQKMGPDGAPLPDDTTAQPPEASPASATPTNAAAVSDLQAEIQAEEHGATASDDKAASADGAPSFVWPVRGTIISAFGPKGSGRDNDGINIAAPKGSPVKASAAGTIVYVGDEMKGFGNLVLIRHPGNWVTAYAHLDRVMVSKNGTVRAGDMIGTIGATGDVGSPQLHFEARREGKPVDPELVLK